MTPLLLTASLMMIVTGCETQRVKIITSDKVVEPVKRGQAYLPPADGWYVPDAAMLTMLNAMDRAKYSR